MGIMTNQNARSGQLAFLLLAFSCLAMFQPGCSKVQDIDQLRQAAEQGDVEAQFQLGGMYSRGEGVPEDDREAVKWYRKAAEQEHASAQYNMGVMYHDGEGVPEDYREAMKWYRKAAEQEGASPEYVIPTAVNTPGRFGAYYKTRVVMCVGLDRLTSEG